VLADRIPDARVLDLCAGVGALGLEALSRGAASVVLVERDGRAARAIEEWAKERGVSDAVRAVAADAVRGRFPPGPYDVVFLDPPFRAWEAGEAEGFLARAVAEAAPRGVVALKLPGRAEVPSDPRWRVADRREKGSVAYALVEPAGG
jgi:16S rRNA (guanine966-N2)-methyltransferase